MGCTARGWRCRRCVKRAGGVDKRKLHHWRYLYGTMLTGYRLHAADPQEPLHPLSKLATLQKFKLAVRMLYARQMHDTA